MNIKELRQGWYAKDPVARRKVLETLDDHYHEMLNLGLILWTTEDPHIIALRKLHLDVLEGLEVLNRGQSE